MATSRSRWVGRDSIPWNVGSRVVRSHQRIRRVARGRRTSPAVMAPATLAPLALAIVVVVGAVPGVSADLATSARLAGAAHRTAPTDAVAKQEARAPDPPPPPNAQPLPVTPGQAPVITRIETTDPVVFLTIDDGLVRHPDSLAAFAELGVPASLFLNDGPIRQGADFFRSMAQTVVQAHTSSHRDMRGLSEERQVQEICGNADLIAATYGKRPTLFRPPFGAYNDATLRAAARCGMVATVLWEADVHRDRITFRHQAPLRAGDIILMHFRPHFRQELQTVARHVQEAGLRFALLEDYIVTTPPPAPAPPPPPAPPPAAAAKPA